MKTVIKLLPNSLKLKSLFLMVLAVIGAYIASLVPVRLSIILDGLASAPLTVQPYIMPFSVLFLTAEIIVIIRRVLSDRLTARFGEVLTNESLRRLTRLSKQTIEENGTSGEITSQVNQATEGACQLLKLATADIVPTVFLGAFVIYQCFTQSMPVFAVMMLAYIICSIIASTFQIYSQKGIREGIIRMKARLNGELVQSINGIEQIRALGAEDAEIKRLAPQITSIRMQQSKHHTYMGFFDTIKQVIKAGFIAAILLVGLKDIVNGSITGGTLIAVFMLFQQLLKPVDEIYRFIDDISASWIKVNILNRLVSLGEDEVFQIPETELALTGDSIKITEYQMFSTHGERKVISQGHNIELKQGVTTAVIAKTGGGKSSLLRGLLRIYPLEGMVNFFGANIDTIPHRLLIQTIHYVPQFPYFFAGTLRDNLAYGLENVSDDDLITALQCACLYDELSIGGSPLNMTLQEGGKPLSGGQAKRLAIARAFLRHPRLYLFDEAFTGLDPTTLCAIFDNLNDHVCKVGAGVVHISHEQTVKDRCSVQIELDTQQNENINS